MIHLGLTGSIGMGKSTTADLFREAGVPVHDSDAAVHAAYAQGGVAVGPVEAAFPGVVVDGRIDRDRLAQRVVGKPEELARLEAIVHPLLRGGRSALIDQAEREGAPVVVYDIPLLFETGAEATLDAVVVVSAPAEMQRGRVLARPGMTEEKFLTILARQTSDAEKRARADFVIDTSQGIEPARAQVLEILHRITAPGWRGRQGVA